MSESLDLRTQVLNSLAIKQAEVAAKIRRDAEAKIWDEDNKYILGYLQAAAGVLAFPELVEKQRDELHQMKRYPKSPDNAEGMEIRPIHWMADNSEATQSQRSKVRAVVGHAVLLSSRNEGVNGSFMEQGEDVGECFYALGAAVEVDGSSWFTSLFAKDPRAGNYDCGNLYRLLTLEKYTNHVRSYNEASYRAFESLDLFPSDADQAAYNLLGNGRARSFKRKMEEDFPGTIMQAGNARQSQDVHDLILGQPKEGDTTYREQLMPRVDVSAIEAVKDRLVLAESFNNFLGQSDIVKGWLK